MRPATLALAVLVVGLAAGGAHGLQAISPELGSGHQGAPSMFSVLALDGAAAGVHDVLSFSRAAERGSRSLFASVREEALAAAGALRDELGGEGGGSDVPQERFGLHFRPVSCTLYCIMVLTGEGLLVFSLLAIARTAEDLAGKLRINQAAATEALACAARGATTIPMLCMLFLACRMYVLATTEGLGDEPLGAQVCMVVATLGVTFQFIVVLLLPCATEPSTEGGSPRHLQGEAEDDHPMLWAHKYTSDGTRSLARGVEVADMVCIYGGACGVILGIFVYPAGATAVSAAVVCTVLLSLLYFGIYAAAWILCSQADIRMPLSQRLQAAKAAVLSASVPVKKAPMFLVVFLAASMRALQLAPPLGRPPWWAEACCYVICAALACEALAAACIGAASEEEPRQGAAAPGEHLFVVAPVYHLAQHVSGGVAYLGILAVVAATFHAKGLDGREHPLSPTMKALLQLAAVFFSASVLQAAVACYQDVTRTLLPKLQKTASAAGSGVTICPLLAVLFVAVRLRALQITDQRGAPPGWVQNSMFVCVFATCAQLACCLAAPLFAGSGAKAGEEGPATREVEVVPLVRAYTISAVRYFAILCLHGSVAAICVAALTMTPDTAMGNDEQEISEWQDLLPCLGIVLLVMLAAALLSSAKDRLRGHSGGDEKEGAGASLTAA